MSTPRITYTPRPNATPGSEAVALAAVYRFILDAAARKKAGVTGTSGDHENARYLPERQEEGGMT